MARKGYVQVVNGFYRNRKVMKLRRLCPSAVGAFVMLVAYCGDELTDGHVDEDTLLYVLQISDEEIDALCSVDMIEPDGNGGYYVHDYLNHNRSRDQVTKQRSTDRTRKRAESNRIPNGNDEDLDFPFAIQSESERIPNGKSENNPKNSEIRSDSDRIPCGKHEKTEKAEDFHENSVRNPTGKSGQTPEHQNTRTNTQSFSSSSHVSNANREKEKTDDPTRLPDDWTPSAPDLDYARGLGLDPESFVGDFRDHHRIHGTRSYDWSAMWRGWCKRRPKPEKRDVRLPDDAWVSRNLDLRMSDGADLWSARKRLYELIRSGLEWRDAADRTIREYDDGCRMGAGGLLGRGDARQETPAGGQGEDPAPQVLPGAPRGAARPAEGPTRRDGPRGKTGKAAEVRREPQELQAGAAGRRPAPLPLRPGIPRTDARPAARIPQEPDPGAAQARVRGQETVRTGPQGAGKGVQETVARPASRVPGTQKTAGTRTPAAA